MHRGRLPSFAADESSHSTAYSLNVGYLRDTGHSAEVMPPAAMADDPSPRHPKWQADIYTLQPTSTV